MLFDKFTSSTTLHITSSRCLYTLIGIHKSISFQCHSLHAYAYLKHNFSRDLHRNKNKQPSVIGTLEEFSWVEKFILLSTFVEFSCAKNKAQTVIKIIVIIIFWLFKVIFYWLMALLPSTFNLNFLISFVGDLF